MGGRPKGATNAAKERKKKRKLEASNEAAVKFMQAKQSHQGKKYGALKKIVDDVNVKYNLDGDDKVKTETVRTRCKKGRKLLVASFGPIPCVLELEPFFVETFMKLAAMRQPVTPTEALQFINSTIRCSGLEGKVKDWKEKHCNLIMEDDDEPVSKKYWAGFLT